MSSLYAQFGRLEKSYKEKGLQGATEFVNELCTNKVNEKQLCSQLHILI